MHLAIDNIVGSFLGLSVGDALGVPVEFRTRSYLKNNPVADMIGYQVWGQPPGTWSDDSSMSFCTAESLIQGYNLDHLASLYVRWVKEGYWSAHDKAFDIGATTIKALNRVEAGASPITSGAIESSSNGNGSLMRILPASLFFRCSDLDILYERITEVSAITHGHFRSVFSCFIFSVFVIEIIKGGSKEDCYTNATSQIRNFIDSRKFNPSEVSLFNRILENQIPSLSEDQIISDGYVIHTLEASLWCFLKTESVKSAILQAVNLGGDTDTTGSVTGAIAGLYYGYDNIPTEWLNPLARRTEIVDLASRFHATLTNKFDGILNKS